MKLRQIQNDESFIGGCVIRVDFVTCEIIRQYLMYRLTKPTDNRKMIVPGLPTSWIPAIVEKLKDVLDCEIVLAGKKKLLLVTELGETSKKNQGCQK